MSWQHNFNWQTRDLSEIVVESQYNYSRLKEMIKLLFYDGQNPQNLVTNSVKIVGFGDSITAGPDFLTPFFEYLMQDFFGESNVTIINSGVNGDTTADALNRIQADVLDHSPDICLVGFGTNDIWYEPPSDIAGYKTNLGNIFDQLQSNNIEPIFWTMPPYDESKTSYTNETKIDYNNAAKDICNTKGVQIVDVFDLMYNNFFFSHDYLMLDSQGVHPDTPGDIMIATLLFRKMQPKLKSIMT